MREVLFKKWIPKEEVGEGAFRRQKEGTNCWDRDFTNAGIFHQWGCSYDEFESGAGNFTVGIIETPDGNIEQVLPYNLKFISAPV